MSGRFLFTCWPFEGHVFPQLSIAKVLQERGNDVAFYTGKAARGPLDEQGVTFFPFGYVDEEAVHRRVTTIETGPQPDKPGITALMQTFREWLVETIPGQLADLRPVIESWQPDVLVTDLAMWAPIVILWESLPIPVALSSTFMGPLVPGPDAPPWGFGLKPPRTASARALAWLFTRTTDVVASGLRRRVNELRAEDGLAPIQSSINAFTGRLPLYLVGNLPELDYNRRDLPPSVHYVGPYLWHPRPKPRTAAWLEAMPADRPWVHVTESTLRHGDPFLLRAAARGLAGQPIEVILTTGRNGDPHELKGVSPATNLHITDWINHSDLLPRCSVLVTRGGAGTIMASLRAGVPLVVVPTSWDKPDNARRVVEAGVGVRLAPRRCTPERLRAAVELVLGEPSYRNNARRVAERLTRAPGPARAAELLEALVADRPSSSVRTRQ